MNTEAKNKYHELKKLLDMYSKQYYLLDDPMVSDAEYDMLYNELLEIEKEYPELMDEQSPSQKIGAAPEKKFKKTEHSAEMLSLENAYNEDDISSFFDRVKKLSKLEEIEFVLEPKFDGLSVALTYKGGMLVSAATRGDGKIGEDVTHNMMVLDIPKKIPDLRTMEIRGEVIMLKSDFQKLNMERQQNSEKLFANPRNAAAGSLRQLDAEVTKLRKVHFFPYAIISNELQLTTQTASIKKLAEFGFAVSNRISVCSTQQKAYEFYKDLEKHRADLDYDIDGVVYKVNDLQIQAKLGSSTKTPRHSIAYKFAAERAETTILDIVVQVGRVGNITPVAELMPVTVGGVVVSRATLHNKDEIEKKDIRIGDRIVLERAGDVIPKILYPIIEDRSIISAPFIFPDKCPCCSSWLVQLDTEVAVKCININCDAQIIERIVHFVSKHAFNIDGCGEQNIKFFFEMGFIKSPQDLFALESKNSEMRLEEIDGWGKRSVDNLFASIRNAKHVTLDKFIYSFGIPQIGRAISKLIAEFFVSYEAFLRCIYESRYDDLLSINGVGQAIVNDVRKFFMIENNMNAMIKLAGDGISPGYVAVANIEKSTNEEFSGQTIVFTGSLDLFSRDEIKELAEKHGAKVASSVSSKTSFVVAGKDAGKKLENAKKLGVKVITEEEFKNFFKESS